MSLPQILTTSEEIADFAARLQKFPVIAVDLEADSMHNYQEKVCLLQFTTPDETLLIDPLGGADLGPLRPILADPAVRKIFHAADYDIRCLARDFDIVIDGLFDTMISSQFLGEEKFGLADVLRKYFGLELDKQYQRADWSKRPMSEGMILYAAADTSNLHQLVEILEQKLIDMDRLEWVQEECTLLEKVRFTVHEGPLFLRFKGAGPLDRRQLAVLEALLQWRDGEALRRDCPLYKVFGNKQLLQIAKLKPQDKGNLAKVEGLSPRLIERYGQKLLEAVATGMDVPEADLPIFPRGERRAKDPAVDLRMDRLKAWRIKAAAELQLDAGVLINNATLNELAVRKPKNAEELTAVGLLKNWQRKVLGDDILKVLNG